MEVLAKILLFLNSDFNVDAFMKLTFTEQIVAFGNGILWGLPMIILLVGAHLYLTYKTGFMQKKIFKAIKLSVSKQGDGKGDVSVFGALTTALASTVGTGNIIGVATAIVSGGPGAVLWTWIGGIFGIATKYAETFIAVKHRKIGEDGLYIGGAMTALDDLGKHFLAKFFCFATILGAFGIGCLTQSNAISSLLQENFTVPKYITGIIVALVTFVIIFGGIKSITNVCMKLVPVMSLVYIAGCLYILIVNASYLPETISLIISSAFSPKAMAGGFIGSTIISASRYGIARGLFSNEAGMGSSPQASAAGQANNAVMPALVGSTGVFWDTVVICLLTGIVLTSCVIANPSIDSVLLNDGSKLCSACFATIPYVGTPLLIFGVMTFAYSTILGWNYYATQCVKYIFKGSSDKIYMFIWIVFIYIGAVQKNQLVWDSADILNALMVIPNIIAVLLLRNEIKKDTDYYLYGNRLDEIDPKLK